MGEEQQSAGRAAERAASFRIEQGLMTPAGLAAIELAKETGTWTAADASDEQIVPDDFANALAAHPAAEQYWCHFSASVRKGILYWIASAKRPETRARRTPALHLRFVQVQVSRARWSWPSRTSG